MIPAWQTLLSFASSHIKLLTVHCCCTFSCLRVEFALQVKGITVTLEANFLYKQIVNQLLDSHILRGRLGDAFTFMPTLFPL